MKLTAIFANEVPFADTTKYIHEGRNLLKLFTFSKVFGLAGLRLGYGITRPDLVMYLARLSRPFHLSTLTLAAGMAAIQDQAHIQHTIDTITSGRGWLYHQLQELGVKVWPSQANFLLIDAGMHGDDLAAKLLAQGVIVSEGDRRFGLPNCIRVTVGLPAHNQRFIEVLSGILEREQLINPNNPS